jgi:hypothetical protein
VIALSLLKTKNPKPSNQQSTQPRLLPDTRPPPIDHTKPVTTEAYHPGQNMPKTPGEQDADERRQPYNPS